MPYFYFDLVVGEEFKDQGGMILEDTQIAFEKADSLASELYIVHPELHSQGCAVRLTDGENKELYRTPVCTENLNPDVVVMKSAKDRV